jgi:hypothetical protein
MIQSVSERFKTKKKELCRGLVVGEMAPGPDRPPRPGIERLDGIYKIRRTAPRNENHHGPTRPTLWLRLILRRLKESKYTARGAATMLASGN